MKKVLTMVFTLSMFYVNAQSVDSVRLNNDSVKKDNTRFNVDGTISVTNNGFSFIPAFTLDAPAAMAVVSLLKKKWSFGLETRFALDGKPWATAYVSNYKVISDDKNDLSIGLQFPATAFVKRSIVEDNVKKEIMEAQQGISPSINYGRVVSSKLMIGVSYLRYEAIGDIFPKHGNYTSVWANIGNLKLSSNTQLSINQQLFYLTIDNLSGWYTAGNIVFTNKNSPFSLSSMFFKTLNSNIGGKDANWNLSLNYTF